MAPLFKIWANATQGDVDDVQFRISIDVDGDEVVDEAESRVSSPRNGHILIIFHI